MSRSSLWAMAWVAACGSCRAQVECPGGWSGSSKATAVIPPDRVNDGYCDCPATGADEPDTNACSGSALWSGVAPRSGDDPPAPMFFTCPQQPSLKLPRSRVNDGVCDCCDGADEPDTGLCKDDCGAILAEERRLRKQLENKYRLGSEKRQQSIQAFETLRKRKLEEAEAMEAEIEAEEQALSQLEEKYETLEPQWVKKRLDAVQSMVTSFGLSTASDDDGPGALNGMIAALSEDELTWWIIHACQMAGEMVTDSSSLSNTKTCIPLRLAALDLGIWWEPDTYEMTMVTESNKDLAKIFDHNLKNFPDNLVWNANRIPDNDKNNRKKNRRRLDDDMMMDDYAPEDDDYMRYHDHDYDDIVDEDEDYRRHHRHHDEDEEYERRQRDKRRRRSGKDYDGDSDVESTGDKREELLSLVKQRSFSISRVQYLERSEKLLSTIDGLTRRQEEEENEMDDEDVPETPEEVEQAEDEGSAATTSDAKEDELDSLADIQFDPMALPMTKNELQRRRKSIERGLDYAISAKVLLDSFHAYSFGTPEQKTRSIQGLAMSVLGHSRLSAVQVWHLYLSVLPEMEGVFSIGQAEEQTCVAPWANLCPPKSVIRDVSGAEFKLPPAPIAASASAYCENISKETPTESICASDKVVPSEVPNGYFGYLSFSARPESDVVIGVFDGLSLEDDDSEERSELLSLQEQIEQKQQNLENLRRSISDTLNDVGGKDGPGTLGRDGELYNLKEKCFSYEAAKYTYELCLFKKAMQKEGRSGGTHLGDWSGEEENEDGSRIWNWQKGAKCWNGPQRSAAAIVTCGTETKVLSADEPETCRYVFEVESPVACDDAFRELHNL